ncbi:MAG TPA: antitoxin Xre/MbcA/ParS toxin-binding domain-containing protein [Solirubrobacteraceae bacterium]|jgi:uncharacterized protein (DUF2384 family)|nr:antitoxin Xre/MbcA/ParS toxin-binding domain-containing protein [Solirubrobacteraceae bacterium]
MTTEHTLKPSDVGSIEVISQLVADEIVLLSTGRRVGPTEGNALDVVMHALEDRLGSRAAAQRWLLSPRPELDGRCAGDLLARGGNASADAVLAHLRT